MRFGWREGSGLHSGGSGLTQGMRFRPRTRLRLRRFALGTVLLTLLFAGIVGAWLVALGAPRPERFSAPRAPIASVAVTAGDSGELVELRAADGFVVRLGVVRDHDQAGPRPVVVVLGGHRTGRDAVRLVGEPGGIAVVAVDYPYDGPDRIRGLWQGLRHAPGMRRALVDTPRALSQALDWILQQPWVDAARVELVGVSLGVPFAAVAGGNDTRFTRVWLIQGAADNAAWLEANLQRRINTGWLRRGTTWLLHRLAHGASFDTATWVARIAPRPVVIVGALDDQRLPREQITRLHEAAGEPRDLLWVPGRHINPRRPETVRPLLDLVRGRVR